MTTLTIRGKIFYPGQEIVCNFADGTEISGCLHISDDNRKMWLCHNHPREKHGNPAPVMYGFEHSWIFYYNSITDTFSEKVISIKDKNNSDITIKEDVVIPSRLNNILSMLPNSRVLKNLFYYNIGTFQNFSKYKISEKPGFIEIHGTFTTPQGTKHEKKAEIKFARFVKRMGDELCKNHNFDKEIFSDKNIELYHEQFVAFQNKNDIKVHFSNGKDILRGYSRSFQSQSAGGTLAQSCMNNKQGYLKMYVANPNIRLAYIESSAGIECRCLIWENKGRFYFDRIYYTFSWLANIMKSKLLDLGYFDIWDLPEEDDQVFTIELNEWQFENYPYLDSFYYLDPKKGVLYRSSFSLLPKGTYFKLQSTAGGYSHVSK